MLAGELREGICHTSPKGSQKICVPLGEVRHAVRSRLGRSLAKHQSIVLLAPALRPMSPPEPGAGHQSLHAQGQNPMYAYCRC